MADILERIVEVKREEITALRRRYSLRDLPLAEEVGKGIYYWQLPVARSGRF